MVMSTFKQGPNSKMLYKIGNINMTFARIKKIKIVYSSGVLL